jgi:hypothetical protein
MKCDIREKRIGKRYSLLMSGQQKEWEGEEKQILKERENVKKMKLIKVEITKSIIDIWSRHL